LALHQLCIRKVISDKKRALMHRILLNEHTKSGAKIFRHYRVITF